MRRTMLVGASLVLGAVVALAIGAFFDLELESVALLGTAVGAVVALVPDRTPLLRLAGFAGGFVIAWITYVLRAAVLPDTGGGRGVAVVLVLVACVLLTAATLDRVPLWAPLLGAAAFAGAYEYTFMVSPPEVADTSVTSATALLLTTAIGFLATAAFAPGGEVPAGRRTRKHAEAEPAETTTISDIMEGTR